MDARFLAFLRVFCAHLRRKLDRKVVLVVVALALMGVCDAALSHAAPPPATPVPPVPTRMAQRTATPRARAPHSTIHRAPQHVATAQPAAGTSPLSAPTAAVARSYGGQPTAVPTVTRPKATPVAQHAGSNDPAEAQTPLHLSDPLGSDPSLTPTVPWWQTLLDITWKLALVVGLIYLAMRALAALKRRGFTPGSTIKTKSTQGSRHLMESIEEIQLAPNHVLHAVRVGDRVMLIARTNGTLRALGETELGEGMGDDAASTLPTAGFAGQLMRAWAGLIPPGAITEEAPPIATPADAAPTADDAIIDAKWSVKPDAASDPDPDLAPILPDLPLRRGTARADDDPPPLTAAEERAILWFAEENGDSAAAKKYGLTRQRVTAMRRRYDQQRAERPRRAKVGARPHPPAPPTVSWEPSSPSVDGEGESAWKEASADRRDRARTRTPLSIKDGEQGSREATGGLGLPDHPRGVIAAEPALPARARTTAARAAYRQATRPTRPDVATPKPTRAAPAAPDATEDQAVTVGQILAARFGIKIPPTT
jgi:flagellar biogenesis protein FliO